MGIGAVNPELRFAALRALIRRCLRQLWTAHPVGRSAHQTGANSEAPEVRRNKARSEAPAELRVDRVSACLAFLGSARALACCEFGAIAEPIPQRSRARGRVRSPENSPALKRWVCRSEAAQRIHEISSLPFAIHHSRVTIPRPLSLPAVAGVKTLGYCRL